MSDAKQPLLLLPSTNERSTLDVMECRDDVRDCLEITIEDEYATETIHVSRKRFIEGMRALLATLEKP